MSIGSCTDDPTDKDWVPDEQTVTIDDIPLFKNEGDMSNTVSAAVRLGLGFEATAKLLQCYELDRCRNFKATTYLCRI